MAFSDPFAHESRTAGPGLAAQATCEERLDRPGRAQDGDRWVIDVGQVLAAAHDRPGPRRPGEGEEVVVVRVSADRRAVRRIRDSVTTPGDLSDKGSALPRSSVAAELGSLEDRGQHGQEQGDR